MKNKKLILLPIFVMGLAMSGCDIETRTIGLASVSKYSNEVTYSEFIKAAAKYVKDSKYGSSTYSPSDAEIKSEIKGEMKQKVTNDAFKQKVRNEAKLKTNGDAKYEYDKDNETFEGLSKIGISLKEENPLLGKMTSSYKKTLNLGGQPNEQSKYAIFDKDNELVYNVELGESNSLNNLISSGVKAGALLLNTYAGQDLSKDPINELLSLIQSEKLTTSIKYYSDENLLTAVFTVEFKNDISSGSYVNDEYVLTTYGKMTINAECVVQLKFDKGLKLVAAVKGNIDAEFSESHSSLLEEFIPTISGLATQDCAKGDKENVGVDLVAAITIAEKDVTIEKTDISKYKVISKTSEETPQESSQEEANTEAE